MVKGAGIWESSMGRPISSQASRRAIWSGEGGLVSGIWGGEGGGMYKVFLLGCRLCLRGGRRGLDRRFVLVWYLDEELTGGKRLTREGS